MRWGTAGATADARRLWLQSRPPIGVSSSRSERAKVKDMSNARITIYTRPLCIWCFRAKRLLRKHGFAFEERDARRANTRSMLLERTGRHTVPQVFFGDRFVGGFEDLRSIADAGLLSSTVQSS